jgi:hypothetical protein
MSYNMESECHVIILTFWIDQYIFHVLRNVIFMYLNSRKMNQNRHFHLEYL